MVPHRYSPKVFLFCVVQVLSWACEDCVTNWQFSASSIFFASLDSFNHLALWPFVCSIYVPKQLAIEFDIRWLLMARKMRFWFQYYDGSFSGCYMKLYKDLLNFLAVMSQKYSRIHIIIIENFKNMVPSIFLTDLIWKRNVILIIISKISMPKIKS